MHEVLVSQLAENVADKIDDLIVGHNIEGFKGTALRDARQELAHAIANMIHEAIWKAQNE